MSSREPDWCQPAPSQTTTTLAQKVATKPAFAPKTTKEAVNRATDAQGQPEAIEHAFALHQLCHAHNQMMFNMAVDPAGLSPAVKDKPPVG